jgi:hypothetical protein
VLTLPNIELPPAAAMERSKVAAAIASIFVTISELLRGLRQASCAQWQFGAAASHTYACLPVAGKAIGGRTAALGSMYLVTGLLSE